MQPIKQSTPQPIPFTAVSSTSNETRLDASTLTFTVRVIKSNGSSVGGGGTGGIGSSGVTQPDVTNAQGCCFYTPSAGDVNTLGPAIVRISASTMETREIPVNVVAYDPYDPIRAGLTTLVPAALVTGHAVTGTLTSIAFSTDLTLAAGSLQGEAHWLFTSGTLAGQVQRISGFSGGILTFAQAFTAAPANNDAGVIINR